MKLPDFDEFIQSLDENEMQKRINAATYGRPVSIQFNMNKPEEFQKAMGQIWGDAAERSILISAEYLRAYHEWLRAMLEDEQA